MENKMNSIVETREPEYRTDIFVDVDNQFIHAVHPKMSLSEIKLLRYCIAMCKKGDRKFYQYEFTVPELAKVLNIDQDNLYRKGFLDMVTTKLMQTILVWRSEDGKRFKKWAIFRTCEYKNGIVRVLLNEDAAELFLNLQGKYSYTKLRWEVEMFLKSPKIIRIYELMYEFIGDPRTQPHADVACEFYLPLDELKVATWTDKQKLYDKISNFKDRILNPAIANIEEVAELKIEYENVKRGHRISGFRFKVWTKAGWEMIEECKKNGEILPQPKYWIRDYTPLIEKQVPGQMEITDFLKQ